MNDILDDLSVKTLPVIQGYNGAYVDEEFVLQTFQEAAAEIKRLRALNEQASKCLLKAAAALGTLSISTYPGSHIATNALRQIEELIDSKGE